MAQAAEVLEFPAGGIADFYMEDHEIEALEREEAAQEFGSTGIATFEPIATRMASYGRYGDDTVAHVETGELIVPKALIDDNPKLRDSIFSHLRELGVEDPERYVVGSGVNSINPDTGMPEFFLKKIFKGVKKAGSKLVKGVSKALKNVTKVVKKAAPFVLPFVLGPAGLGFNMMYAGALGAGIGTLIQGGSLKEAVTAGLIGGAIGGVSQGVSSGLSAGKGNFLEGFTKGVKNVATNPMQSSFTQAMTLSAPAESATLAQSEIVPKTSDVVADAADIKFIEGTNIPDQGISVADLQDQMSAPRPEGLIDASLNTTTPATTTGSAATTAPAATTTPTQFIEPPKAPGFFESLQDAVTPGGQGPLDSLKDAFFPSSGPTPTDVLKANNINPLNATSAQLEAAKEIAKEAATGFGRTYLPAGTVATAGAAYGLSKAMDDNEDEEDEEERRRREEMERLAGPNPIFEARPGDFTLSGFIPQYATGDVFVPTTFTQGLGQYGAPTTFAADGGEIFPRRVGGIMPDEGTPGKDSVKAMLMPGEFVMTTNAVKGLGDGDNNKGISRMYDMMRGLEAKGKAMA